MSVGADLKNVDKHALLLSHKTMQEAKQRNGPGVL